MLTRMIVSGYVVIVEISLWLFIAAGTFWGARMGQFTHGEQGFLIGGVIGLVGSFAGAALLFGAFLILEDIRNAVRAIEKAVLESPSTPPPEVQSPVTAEQLTKTGRHMVFRD